MSSPAATPSTGAYSLRDVCEHLRELVRHSTHGKWHGEPAYPIPAPPHPVRVRADRREWDVASVGEWRDLNCLADARTYAPMMAVDIECVLAMASSQSVIAPSDANVALTGGWTGDTRWAWSGWDPATGTERPVNPRTGREAPWTPHVDVTRTVVRGTRAQGVPRALILDNWSEWSVDPTDPRRVIREAAGTPPERRVVAEFTRAEDAAFTVFARVAMARFGASKAAAYGLIDSDPDGELHVDHLLHVLESAEPWPLVAQAQSTGMGTERS